MNDRMQFVTLRLNAATVARVTGKPQAFTHDGLTWTCRPDGSAQIAKAL